MGRKKFVCDIAQSLKEFNKFNRKAGKKTIKKCPFVKMCARKEKGNYPFCERKRFKSGKK